MRELRRKANSHNSGTAARALAPSTARVRMYALLHGAGRYILVGRSVAGEALVPLPPKTIRADMLLEGFLIKPVRTATA
jgi:hypothetical protein